MSNKRIRPIKMTVIFTAQLTLCMAQLSSEYYYQSISSLNYFEIASCTRVALLNIVTFYCDGSDHLDLNLEASFAEQNGYFSSFLWTMASNCTSMNYKRAVLKNRRLHNLLALCLSTRTC